MILLLLGIGVLFFYFVYRVILWISKKKARIHWTLFLLGILVLAKLIDLAFFTKMEAIQSNVYKNLYLIKNSVNNRDSVDAFIKQISQQRMNSEFMGNEEKYRYYNRDSSNVWLSYSLDFYNYNNNFFGSNTAHFINYEEDDGGPTSIYFLSKIEKERLAEFRIRYCEDDSINYYAVITYYANEYERKTDTIISQCIYVEKEPSPEKAPVTELTGREDVGIYTY